jgi:monothiol glutaredoxin
MTQPRTLEEWTEQIKRDIADNHIFVYAKGEKNAAMCGFSHRVMEIFNRLSADYQVCNIFTDPNIRPALCAFTNWPTTPQVFIDGKFVGGCDILTEMYQTGELQKLLGQAEASSS